MTPKVTHVVLFILSMDLIFAVGNYYEEANKPGLVNMKRISEEVRISSIQGNIQTMKSDIKLIDKAVNRTFTKQRVSSIEKTLHTSTLMLLYKPVKGQKYRSYKFTKKDVQCLAKNIYYEAGVENDLGKYAVAQVTYNRAVREGFPNSICAVVYAKAKSKKTNRVTCAFSWVCMKKPEAKGILWERSLAIARDFVESGVQLYPVRNALFYHTGYIKAPYWASEKHKIGTIGQHIFYSLAAKAKKGKSS